MRRLLIALGALAATVPWSVPAHAGGGCGGPVTSGRTTNVVINHACFEPGITDVAVGATVKWVNGSGVDHNLSGAGHLFGGITELPAGGTATITFPAAGTFPYACTLHGGMTGAVVVGGSGATDTRPIVDGLNSDTVTVADEGWTDNAGAVGGAGAAAAGLGLAAGFVLGRRRTAPQV